MRKFNFRGVVLCLAILEFAISCMDDPRDTSGPGVGTLSVNLIGSAASGAIYRLRDAVITVSGPGGDVVFRTEDDPSRTSLSANVATGSHSALVQPGWRLERMQGSMALPVTGEQVSDNPVLFTVTEHQRTTVPLRFRINAEQVNMDRDQGYDVVLDIEETGAAHGIVVSSAGGRSLEVFPIDANGNVAPTHLISGSHANLSVPRGLAVVGNEIVVVDGANQANQVEVFPVDAHGDVTAKRRIAGVSTKLSTPNALFVLGNEIYVAQQTNSILVFPLAANGDVAPTRTISGSGQTQDLAIQDGEIYAADLAGRQILVFSAMIPGLPTRIIAGPETTLGGPTGLVLHGRDLYVSDASNRVLVFPRLASGNVAPLRVIGGANSGLSGPNQMAIVGDDLYVTSPGNHSVKVFPVSANGNVVPRRTIVGAATQLITPSGIAVF